MRLLRSALEIALFVAPMVVALAGIVVTLVFWPGGILGAAVLLFIAWLCHKGAERIDREHHW